MPPGGTWDADGWVTSVALLAVKAGIVTRRRSGQPCHWSPETGCRRILAAMDFRNCLVTGANRGLGLEFAKQLLATGAHVVATCRHPGKATALNALVGE